MTALTKPVFGNSRIFPIRQPDMAGGEAAEDRLSTLCSLPDSAGPDQAAQSSLSATVPAPRCSDRTQENARQTLACRAFMGFPDRSEEPNSRHPWKALRAFVPWFPGQSA